ncbi:MAG: phosphate starvation-inducible protein PhoH [Candidatus Lindowbacteria bacterium RIFCSPLOWO2_12_FULL_62_27]|nr:MAG: phosphate starvation-inducible protein PhoH [Candidatus Lindowbacteria bacterium RIFCSPLOWO2_12_FULL_62_27]OGH62332.1 MAG: phosphate starvation-inducible protein PhoH [Candidatus Lindowbacteria bacterium RIFCSPLOWO2_02_FULL_62_12]
MKKFFIFDTNVLLHEPTSLFDFEDNTVVLPIVVIEELDTFKKREDQVGRNSRLVSNYLDELRLQGSLAEGVPLPGGGKILIELHHMDLAPLPEGFAHDKADNRILALTLHYKQKYSEPVVLVSKDLNLRVKADALGIPAEDYEKNKVDPNALYRGHRELTVKFGYVDRFYKEQSLPLAEFPVDPALCANECVMLIDATNPSHTALGRVNARKNCVQKLRLDNPSLWGIKPKNREQRFGLDVLLDDDVPLISLVGMAGTGKTLLALAAGLEKVVREEKYQKLFVMKPLVPLGRDIGYLPGELEEKLLPRMQSIQDNLDFLFSNVAHNDIGASDLEELMDSGIVDIQALTYIRGRSIPNVFIIVDEAQNLTMHEVKTIITRAGQGTKIIFTGDLAQIDNPYLDATSNGLALMVERMKGQGVYGHVLFTKGERSELAELAAQLL